MKLYIYKNNTCMPHPDPRKSVGLAKQFKEPKELDEFLAYWISLTPLKEIVKHKVYICDDSVDFNVMDTYVQSEGELVFKQNFVHSKFIEEVNILEWAERYSAEYVRRQKQMHERAIAARNRNIPDEVEEAKHYLRSEGVMDEDGTLQEQKSPH